MRAASRSFFSPSSSRRAPWRNKREWLGSMHADAAERVLTEMLGCSRDRNGAVRAQAHKGGTEPGVAAANGESPQQRMVRSFQRPSAKKLIAERIAREERDARRFPIQPASGALCIFAAAAGGPPVPLSRFSWRIRSRSDCSSTDSLDDSPSLPRELSARQGHRHASSIRKTVSDLRA